MSKKIRPILEAAGQLLSVYGYNAVSMEAVAKAAAVSKATLYKFFPDKERLFQAVAAEVAARVTAVVDSELAKPGDADTRIARALAARHRLVFQLVDSSVHAKELMVAKERVAHDSVAEFDQTMIDSIAFVLSSQPIFKTEANAIACALFHGSCGIAGAAQDENSVCDHVFKFASAYLTGLRTLAARDVSNPTQERAQ